MKILDQLEQELQLRGCSGNTIDSYRFHCEAFIDGINKDINEVTQEDIKQYFYGLLVKNLSSSTIGLKKSAIKFLFEEILEKPLLKIKTPKIKRKLPVVLTREEIKKIIDHAGCERNKLLIAFLYSSGLRLSECLNLRVSDLDLGRKMGWVRDGKGGKDRMFIISEEWVNSVTNYIETKKVKTDLLFTHENLFTCGRAFERSHLSTRYVQKMIHDAAHSADIDKNVHPHTLRHSFATELYERGVDIMKIQKLLGHSDLSTTQRYVQIAKKDLEGVTSPLDQVKKETIKKDKDELTEEATKAIIEAIHKLGEQLLDNKKSKARNLV